MTLFLIEEIGIVIKIILQWQKPTQLDTQTFY